MPSKERGLSVFSVLLVLETGSVLFLQECKKHIEIKRRRKVFIIYWVLNETITSYKKKFISYL